MKTTSTFPSNMAPHIERYLALKQALGREYDGVRRVLAHLDEFVTTHGGELTAEIFAGWCWTLQHLASGTRRNRMPVARNLCLYRRRLKRLVLSQFAASGAELVCDIGPGAGLRPWLSYFGGARRWRSRQSRTACSITAALRGGASILNSGFSAR